MTSSKISQIAALMKTTELLNTQSKSQEADLAFGTLLSQTAGGGDQALLSWNGSMKESVKADSVNQAAYEKESAQTGYRESSIARSETSDIKSKLPEDTTEKLDTFEKKITETLAEKLGVTEKEVIEQMEALGLTVLDLMEPSKLAGLVMELTGSEDIGSLLLSEDFQQLLGQVGELSQDLMTQLNLTPEEMTQFMEQLETMVPKDAQTEELPVQNVETETEITEPAVTGNVEETTVQAPEQSAGNQQSASEASKTQQNVQDVSGKEQAEKDSGTEQAVVSDVQKQTEEQDQAAMAEEGSADASEKSMTEAAQDSKGTEKAESQQGHITYQTTTQTINQGQAVEVTQTVVQTRIDVEDIIRQVSQMTRVSISQAESSIEMQLNPANLGKVYLQVVSREGAITAQIAAQNEAVKEALESQIAVLKENMNQQGMKVEAIEVTIASHEFERNLEENQQNPTKEQQEQEMQKSFRRNINLNNLDELQGLMSEEEDLVARIMADNGNSVDLTA